MGLGMGMGVLAACTSVQPVKDPVPFLERNNPEYVRMYSPGKELVVLKGPRLMSDGTIRGFDLTERIDTQYSIKQFQAVEAKQLDKHRTFLFALGSAMVVGTTIWAIQHNDTGTPRFCDRGDCVSVPGNKPSMPVGLRLQWK